MKKLLYSSLLSGILLVSTSVIAADNRSKPAADKDAAADATSADQSDDQAVDAAPPTPRKVSCRPTAIDVVPEPNGIKTLSIHFHWALYPDSSIEVRLVPGKPSKKIKATPIYFHEQLKGKVQEEFFQVPRPAGAWWSRATASPSKRSSTT